MAKTRTTIVLCLALLSWSPFVIAEDDHYYDQQCSDVLTCFCYFSGYDYLAECVRPEMTFIPDNLSFNITALGVHGTKLEEVTNEDLAPYRYLKALDFKNNNITFIENGLLNPYGNLESFTIQNNLLTSLAVDLFANNRKLKIFEAYDNMLSQIPNLSGLNDLEIIHMQSNEITNIPSGYFSGCGKVTELNLDGNLLTSLDVNVFVDMTNLEILRISNNNLNTLSDNSFKGLTSLQEAYLDGNKIASVGVSLFPGSTSTLHFLNISDNQLTGITSNAFSAITNLDSLYIGGNKLTSVPPEIDSLTKLTKLNMDMNQFTTIPRMSFSTLPKLTELFLGGMETLTSVQLEAFDGIPDLQRLSLSGNTKLVEFTPQHIDPAENPNLSQLYLDRCGFVYLAEATFSQFPNLIHVDLFGNKLNCSCDLKWMPRVVAEGVQWALHWESSSTPPTCYTPAHLYDYPIPAMQEEDMTCAKLQMERISPEFQTMNIRRSVNFTAHLFIGLPDSLWITPDNTQVIPFPEGEIPLDLRVYATFQVVDDNNAVEAVLFLSNISTTDEGRYRLIATNIVGNDTIDFHLDVLPYELTLPPVTTPVFSRATCMSSWIPILVIALSYATHFVLADVGLR